MQRGWWEWCQGWSQRTACPIRLEEPFREDKRTKASITHVLNEALEAGYLALISWHTAAPLPPPSVSLNWHAQNTVEIIGLFKHRASASEWSSKISNSWVKCITRIGKTIVGAFGSCSENWVQIPVRNNILGQSRIQNAIRIKTVVKARGHSVGKASVFHTFQGESLCSERNSFHLSPLSSTPAKPFCYSHVSQ